MLPPEVRLPVLPLEGAVAVPDRWVELPDESEPQLCSIVRLAALTCSLLTELYRAEALPEVELPLVRAAAAEDVVVVVGAVEVVRAADELALLEVVGVFVTWPSPAV